MSLEVLSPRKFYLEMDYIGWKVSTPVPDTPKLR